MSDRESRLLLQVLLALVAWGVVVLFVGKPLSAQRRDGEKRREALRGDIQRYLSPGGTPFPEYEKKLQESLGLFRQDREALEKRLSLRLDPKYVLSEDETLPGPALKRTRIELQRQIRDDAASPAEQTTQGPINVANLRVVENAFGIPEDLPAERDALATYFRQLGVVARVWEKILAVNDRGLFQSISSVDELQILPARNFPEGGDHTFGRKLPVRVTLKMNLRALMAFLDALDEEGRALTLESIAVRPFEDQMLPLWVTMEIAGLSLEGVKATKTVPKRLAPPPGI